MLTMVQTPTVRPFKPSDAWEMANRDGDQLDHAQMVKQASLGPAFTAVLDDRPIAMGGMILLWPGVGAVWMTLTEDVAPYRIWLTRTVKTFLDDLVVRHQLHRVEAVALLDSPRNQAWLEALGFTREVYGIAHRYLQDQRSVVRYERTGDH